MYISSDTNVWIDFCEIGYLEVPFRLEHRYFISRDTFTDELLTPTTMKQELLNCGLRLADVAVDEYEGAMLLQSRYSRLSFCDALALSIAKERAWVLLSGDRPLREAASAEGVECHGTIWICDQLKEQEKVTDGQYGLIIDKLISAVERGRCRLPMKELLKRKR